MTGYMPILVLSSLFFCIILIFSIVLISDIRTYTKKRDVYYVQQLSENKKELSEIKELIRNEVSDIFKQIKNILKNHLRLVLQ